MKKVAVLVRQPHRQYEALRSGLGCLLEDHRVTYLVLDYPVQLDEAFSDNLGFLDEMEGRRYSNHPVNVTSTVSPPCPWRRWASCCGTRTSSSPSEESYEDLACVPSSAG